MDFKEFFNKYKIVESDKIIIACSGGSDSMFLVSEIIKIHQKESIIVAHFNHQLRGQESDLDQKFVENFCRNNGLKLEIGTSDIKKNAGENKIGIEEAARNERYKFLKKIKNEYKAKYIFIAHHLDDNIETVIFNLIRGTRLNGLTGIEENSQEYLRPLLHVTKKEILNKCTEEGIEFTFDSSNKDDNYLRNHIRLNITPEFEKINPNYTKAFDGIIGYFSELKIFLDDNIIKYINSEELIYEYKIYKNYLLITDLENLSYFLQKELVAYIFKIRNEGTIGLTKGNIDEIIKFIFDRGNYTKKEIKKLMLFKKNGKIYF